MIIIIYLGRVLTQVVETLVPKIIEMFADSNIVVSAAHNALT